MTDFIRKFVNNINLQDILTLVSIFGGGCIVTVFFKRFSKSRNVLKNNKAGGNIAGGDISCLREQEKVYTESKNILKDNIAGADIAGGDIEKC